MINAQVANGGWVPRDPGAPTANTHQGGRALSDQFNPQPSHEPAAPPPIAPVTQKPKGPVEINKPKKKDNDNPKNNNGKNQSIDK